MLPLQFIATDIHFAISLLVALALFATCWLYLDAWTGGQRSLKDLLKWAGYGVLAIGFMATATQVESSSFANESSSISAIVALILRGLGYIILIVGLALDPLQQVPKTLSLELEPKTPPPTPPAPTPPPTTSTAPAIAVSTGSIQFGLPLLAFAAAGLYWRRATQGLERHLRPVAWAFTWFGAYELTNLANLWRGSDNPQLQNLIAPLGIVWLIEHAILFTGGILLGRWVWKYLTKRLLSQLFMTTTSMMVAVVLVATISITGLLLSSLQKTALNSLESSAKVLLYAVDSKAAETRASSEILAQNPVVTQVVTTNSRTQLLPLVSDLLATKHLSDVLITSKSGQVLVRASDPERYGDSLSDDSLVQRALAGTTTSSLASRSGVLAPTLVITTASPIRQQNTVVGVALTSLALDNAFVDGIKNTTGLDSTVYSGDIRAASTLTGPDGTSRQVGAKETHSEVLKTALKNGKVWNGSVSASNQAFLASYLPLKDADNTIVGMLFIGQPQDVILATAEEALKLTFVSAVLLLLISMAPIYLISRQIAGQLH